MTLPNASKYWGAESWIMKWDWGETFMLEFIYLMMNEWMDGLWPIVVSIHLLALIFAFAGKYLRISHLVVFLTTVWLYHRLTLYIIGGNLLVIALLFYLIFANERKSDQFSTKLNSLILLAIKVQVCFVYFFSGLWKLAGDQWLKGEAMHYILNIPEYSHPFVIEYIANSKIVTVPATFIALAYQLLFPFLIWFRIFKKPLLIVGVLFHLIIGLAMGIWDFALIMIASYTAFMFGD
ncbi:MAG: HTTM domain-containing protein [Bacteroidota bacterium]